MYSRRRARHALLGVSQASLISNYTVWLEFLRLNGVSMLFQSDLGMKPPRVTKQVVVGATAISSVSVGRHQRSDSCCCLFFFLTGYNVLLPPLIQFPNVPVRNTRNIMQILGGKHNQCSYLLVWQHHLYYLPVYAVHLSYLSSVTAYDLFNSVSGNNTEAVEGSIRCKLNES